MAWKETCVMDERMCFVAACLEGDVSVASLCRHFGISRKTGHKWLGRYRAEGALGLVDHSRAPHSRPRSVPDGLVDRILAVRHRYRSWGPRKVRGWLMDHHPETVWPAASTIGALFDRAGLTRPRKRRRRVAPQSLPFHHVGAPNDVWCMDFKGWFLTGDGSQVDPFTLSDAHSRYLLACEAVARTDAAHVWRVLERTFHEHGLPFAARSDNGPPFAGFGVAGLTQLSVKLVKVGIWVERIAPGKPLQNGRHERMHLTLKQETANPPARSLAAQMERFAAFRTYYNEQRPHEALGQVPPARHWAPSPRIWDGRLRAPEYDDGVAVRKVRRRGEIKWRGRLIFVSQVLAGEPVGLYRIGEESWLVKFGPVVLGTVTGGEQMRRIKARPARSGSPRERPALPPQPPSLTKSGRASDGGSGGKAMSSPRMSLTKK